MAPPMATAVAPSSVAAATARTVVAFVAETVRVAAISATPPRFIIFFFIIIFLFFLIYTVVDSIHAANTAMNTPLLSCQGVIVAIKESVAPFATVLRTPS